MPAEPTVPFPRAARTILAAAAVSGLAAGLAEAGIQVVRRWLFGALWLFGPDLVWITPLADLTLFALAAIPYGLVAALAPPLRRPAVAGGCFGALAAFAALTHLEGLHLGASAILATGIGSVAARRFAARGLRLQRVALSLAVAVAGLAVAVHGAGHLAEWRAVRALPPAAPGRPNVLLLVLDTVRAWNLGLYGHGRPTTPLLDRRAQSGLVFNRALATSPWTLPSHASLFTGRWPFELSANWETALDDGPPTLAEVLRDAGYLTGGFVANYRYTGRSTGLARGFARYHDYPLAWDEALRMTGIARRVLRLPRVQEWLGRNRILEATPAEQVNREFLAWVEGRGTRPFFAFLNYIDAHSPYLPPAPFDSLFAGDRDQRRYADRYLAAVERAFGRGPMPQPLLREYLDGYDGALRYLDGQIDSLLGELDRRGLLANTVVVLASDHGEHFGEHGLIQHGNSLYLPLLHVPLVIWAPGAGPGRRIAAPVSLRDLPATVLELAGVPNPGLPGRSLAGWWGAASDSFAGAPIVSAVDWHDNLSRFPPSPLLAGSLRSLLVDGLHYIRRADGREELYDPDRDFLEARSLVADPRYAEVLERARAAARAAFGGDPGPAPGR